TPPCVVSPLTPPTPRSTLFPYTTLFRSLADKAKTLRLGRTEPLTMEFASLTTFSRGNQRDKTYGNHHARLPLPHYVFTGLAKRRSEEHTSELQSRENLVCRLLLEKKNNK